MTSDLFKKFPSLTNIEHEKDIRWWLDNFPTLKNEKFIVREKLDRTNVQILFMPDGSRKIGRRTDRLKENPHVDTYNREVFSLGGKVIVPLLKKYL